MSSPFFYHELFIFLLRNRFKSVGKNMILCTAPRRGKKPFPSVAVGVMASLIGHRWSKCNPLKALLPMATSSKGKRPNGAASTQPRATPWVSGLPVICALKGQKLYVVGAFALTGRVYHGARIPRALPRAMSALAFQAALPCPSIVVTPMATEGRGSLAFQATEAAEAIEATKATEGIEPNEATHPSCVMVSKTFPTCSLTITYIT